MRFALDACYPTLQSIKVQICIKNQNMDILQFPKFPDFLLLKNKKHDKDWDFRRSSGSFRLIRWAKNTLGKRKCVSSPSYISEYSFQVNSAFCCWMMHGTWVIPAGYTKMEYYRFVRDRLTIKTDKTRNKLLFKITKLNCNAGNIQEL